MKSFLLVALISVLLGGSMVLAKDMSVSPYGKLFVGEGITVQLATIEGEKENGLNDVLVRITGPEANKAGIDGKILLLTTERGGNGIDFKYTDSGEVRNRMSSRSAWGVWEILEVYFGTKTIKTFYKDKDTKSFKPKTLLTEYNKSSKK